MSGDSGQGDSRRSLVAGIIVGCKEAFRGRIASEVLQGLSALSPAALGRLKAAIDECVEVRGFRRGHASQRLGPGLAPVIRDHLAKPFPTLAPAVLQAWMELKGAIFHEARALLQQGGFPVIDPAPYPEFASNRDFRTVFEWTAKRLAGRTEEEKDDILLAAFCLTQWGPSSETDVASTEALGGGDDAGEVKTATSKDDDLLGPFRDLPPEDEFWENLDGFVEKLQELRAEKIASQLENVQLTGTTARRQELEVLLRRLGEEHKDTFEYFEIAAPDSPNFDAFDDEAVTAALGFLAEMDKALKQAAVDRTWVTRTRQDDARKQQNLGRLHEGIVALSERLSKALGGGKGSEPAPALEANKEPSAPATTGLGPEREDASNENAARKAEEPVDVEAPTRPVPEQEAPPAPQLPPSFPVESWSDEQLYERLARAARSATETPAEGVLAEVQLRWLARGLNLRAWVLASWVEDEAGPSGNVPVPDWLCWLAIHMSDVGAAGLALPPEAYVNQLLSEPWSDVRRIRFLIGWLSLGLLGDNVAKAMAVAEVFPEGIGEGTDLPGEAGSEFLLRRIIEPARRGQRPLSKIATSRSELEARVHAALADAEGRRQLSERQFKNLKVKRFWFNLSGPSGPMSTLLERVRNGAANDIPTVERFAAKVDGQDEIIGNYRNTIDHRLEGFLRSLRVATVALAELRSLEEPASGLVTPDDIRRAARSLQEAVPKLERERCPSLNAYRRLSVKLASLANAEDRE